VIKSTNISRTLAIAKVTVTNSEREAFDRCSADILNETRIVETFTGDIEGHSIVRALEYLRGDGSASLISLQRVVGSLNGRRGAFVLQGHETVADGTIDATWFVVPGSGTDELRGLRGEGGFTGQFGQGSTATLEYWFE
jgi:hypothetical protein